MSQSLFQQAIFQPDIGVPDVKNLFNLQTTSFSNSQLDNLGPYMEYHCVYILENGADAYIGETKDIGRSIWEHLSKHEKNYIKRFNFQRLHIISGRLGEIGMAKYQENQLCILMELDGKFKIKNRSKGEPQHCLRKDLFEWYFDRLWPKLVEAGLVKPRSFTSVLNLSTYKFSPYTALTQQQEQALNGITNSIDYWENQPGEKPRPILVCGDAGTGKTVLAASLFYYYKTSPQYRDKRIALVYANSSTRAEIGNVFKATTGFKKKDIVKPIDIANALQPFDIVICDEAHRLRQNRNLGHYGKLFRAVNQRLGLDISGDELDWILTNSRYQVLLYDEKQRTSPCDIPHQGFAQRLVGANSSAMRLITLDEQMRIRAGNAYVSYIYDILYQNNPARQAFDCYDFKIFTSMPDMKACLDAKEASAGLCRFGAGYGWPWRTKNGKEEFDFILDGVKVLWNQQTAGWLGNEAAKHQMGSIYTLPGLDLNYAGIVIGPEVKYDKKANAIKIDNRHFFDNKVKKGVPEEELKAFILNSYAVLLTRAIKGTYLYIVDDSLREYISRYIPYSTDA